MHLPEVANHTIRRMKGKCIRKNILIAGLLWLGFVSCKMVNEAEKQRKEADERALGQRQRWPR